MQSVNLNLIPGSVLPVVNVSQYDVGRQFKLNVYEGATTYSLTGKTVEIRGTKPDGNGFAYDSSDGALSVSNNTVTISTLEQMTPCAGKVMCELRISSGTTVLGTLNFIMDCEPSALADDVPLSETDIPVIERNLEAALAEAEADALVAEGWAKGTQNGESVSSGTYYQDNAEYYKEQAANSASDADVEALKAEGFAVGEQNGTPVTSGSPYYENNAEYYAQRAAASVAQGTQVDFYTQDGHLYVRQTIQGVPQTPVDLGPVGGASNLADLSDVALSSLANQQGLVYNSTSQKWENKDVLLKDGSVAADNLTVGRRASGSTVGTNSVAEGVSTTASGAYSHAEGSATIASGGRSHAEGSETTASGQYSHAEGVKTTASGDQSHAEGRYTTATYYSSHAEGFSAPIGTETVGIYSSNRGSHAEGYCGNDTAYIRATGDGAHAEGYSDYNNMGTLASGGGSHAEGSATTASGFAAHAEGDQTVASGQRSHAEGMATKASGDYSHAEGQNTYAQEFGAHAEGYSYYGDGSSPASGVYASGQGSHAEGYCSASTGAQIKATGTGAHAEGYSGGSFTPVTASGTGAHAEGSGTTASGSGSHAEGQETIASGSESHAEGFHTTAAYRCNHAQGHWNKDMASGSEYGTTGNAMVIGNGNVNSLSNAFRVTFAGQVYGLSAFNSSGADYAEFFEWADGNEKSEDRVGLFVTLDGKKIKPANKGDYILGIISGQPSVVGNGDEDWLGRWQRDDFGRFIWGEIETENPETGEKEKGWTILPNPDYDNTKEYVERKDRKEWDYVGMLGTLAVRDNGKCKVNGFCACGNNGIAVPAESGYRVIARVSKNVIRVIFR